MQSATLPWLTHILLLKYENSKVVLFFFFPQPKLSSIPEGDWYCTDCIVLVSMPYCSVSFRAMRTRGATGLAWGFLCALRTLTFLRFPHDFRFVSLRNMRTLSGKKVTKYGALNFLENVNSTSFISLCSFACLGSNAGVFFRGEWISVLSAWSFFVTPCLVQSQGDGEGMVLTKARCPFSCTISPTIVFSHQSSTS